MENSKAIFNTKRKELNENVISQIINNADLINKIYEENMTNLDNKHMINEKDKKIMKFIFNYISKSLKNRDIAVFLNLDKKKLNCMKNQNTQNNSTDKNLINNNSANKINLFISNFINICIINYRTLSQYYRASDSFMFNALLKLTKFLFLKDFIHENGLKIILSYQLFLCVYNNNRKSEYIENVKQLYLVMNFLLSFCNNKSYNLNEKKTKEIMATISFLIKFLKENILINFANVCLLARNKDFLKLIEFCQITSFDETNEILSLLVEVYKYKLNIDFILDDLSDQFLYKIEKDSMINKTKLLIAKNNFLNKIFKKEIQLIKGEIIKNGFYFSDFSKNGIQCESINPFPVGNKGYSIVVSFKLMKNNKNNNDKAKFIIFSFKNKDKNQNIMNVYIENNQVKIDMGKNTICEIKDKIKINESYILWIIQTKEKKPNMIIYLNENKTIIKKVSYPEGNYKINLGCNINENDISIDNFVGIIGAFILFNKCLIKDEKDFRNITKLIELKGNYEGIPYAKTKREWSFTEKNINLTLNLLSNDIEKDKNIEFIISSKSFGNDNLIYNPKNILSDFNNEIYCNYFQNSINEKSNPKFKFRNKAFLENNKSFPIFSHNSFFDFLNGHGFLYLQLELYYLIGVISLKIEDNLKDKNIKNIQIFDSITDEEDFYTYLTEVCNFFFVCIDALNSSICFNVLQNKMFQNEIKNFNYTLIDLVTMLSKYNCKMKIYFLMLFCQKIKEKKYFEYCSFILTFQFYESSDNETFNAIFCELNHLFKDDCDNTQVKTIFIKLLAFDKLYLMEKIEKNIKHEYSKLMRLLLKKSMDEDLKECLDEYKSRVKQLKSDFLNDNLSMDASNIPEEEYIYGSEKRSNKPSMDSSNNKEGNNIIISSRKESSFKRESIESNTSNRNNDKNLEYLILIYKYLKNLYISISTINDRKSEFKKLSEDKKDEFAEFFNDLFNHLERIYPIENNNPEKDLKIIKALKISEYIKSLCIRFLDDYFFKENYTYIKEEEEKLKNRGEDLEELDNKSTGSIKMSNSGSRSFAKSKLSSNKGNQKGSFINHNSTKNLLLNLLNQNSSSRQNSMISNYNIANNTAEEILTRQMEFFEDFTLSPYTFRSLFLMLFYEYPNDKKIKFVKNKKEQNMNFCLEGKRFKKKRYLLKVILKVLEKLNSDEIDSFFMNKLQLIEYSYKIFFEVFKNSLKIYLKNDNKTEEDKSMIKSLFIYQKNTCYMDKFYKIILADISSIKDNKQELLIKIQNDMKEFINGSLFNLEEQFYFKTLREIFFENNNLEEYAFNLEIFLMEIISEKLSKNEKNKIIEINCKNTLILLYKTIFFFNKRSKIVENEAFLKEIFTFLSQIMDHSIIIYTKILFLIDDSRGKLLIEIIYEIIFELYLEHLKNPKIKSLKVVESLLNGLFNKNKLKTSLGAQFKDDSISKFFDEEAEDFSPFYIMDKISDFNYNKEKKGSIKITENFSINKNYFELRDELLEMYKTERIIKGNAFSVSILFSIKLILSIKELHEFYANHKNTLSPTLSSNSDTKDSDGKNKDKDNNDSIIDVNDDMFFIELKNQFINLCKNIQRIQKESKSANPFKVMGLYTKNIYEVFRTFIVDKLKFNNEDYKNKIYELIENLRNHQRDVKPFLRVIYTSDGKTKEYNEKTISNILKNLKKQVVIIDNLNKQEDSVGSVNDMKSNDSSNNLLSKVGFNLKGYDSDLNGRKTFNKGSYTKKEFYLNANSSHSQNQLIKKHDLLYKTILDNIDNKIIYEPRINFKKDLIRRYFSIYFRKLLTCDEDYLNIKRIYSLRYYKEIKDIDKYKISYPIRIKNYICNNYDKIILKRDFDFFTDGYFQYSHGYLFNQKSQHNYKFRNKFIFPNKQLIRENDCLFKEIFSNNIINKATKFECEMITIKGSIFGNIFIFDNCLFFKSDIENDKRKVIDKNYEEALFYACCTIDYDFLKKDKNILMEYNNIKEVINRTFTYVWVAVEIFLKDGRSFLFNLFNKEFQSEFFEVLKRQKIHIIKKVGEYYRKEELARKWREEKISTYDYLLLLNKLSSRSYNDTNQYPVMPWLFLIEGKEKIRNFDLPISVQDKTTQEQFLSKDKLYLSTMDALIHGNHYSTSAYMCFYLMRTNPFTNMMIRFQSNCFDVPDRQYFDIKQTLNLCQNLSNNREMIPELYSIPETYINLNDNDFGKQKEGVRVHNISFQPYANDPFQFCYLIKDLMNNNIEINNQINRWFDFIFGVNQLGNYSSNRSMTYQERENYQLLRKFNTYCYGKFSNYDKIELEAQKHSRDDKKSLYDEIKTTINLVTNFGQSPYQILSDPHPPRNKYLSNSRNNSSKYNYQLETNIFDENISNDKNLFYTVLCDNKNVEDFQKPRGQEEIIFFTKSPKNDFLYVLLKNGIINIYRFDSRHKKTFVLLAEVKPSCQFLSLKETKNKNQVFNPKYLFCEINENSFIFGRTLDRTLIYYNFFEKIEISFLLKSYTISIISFKNNEFITGSDNGHLGKWRIIIDNKNQKADIELILMVKSNLNAITSLYYDERLNVIISSDVNSIAIRKVYDFEYLNSITIKENKNKYITDIKVSDFNFLYVLIYNQISDSHELQGYTINGSYFGKYEGNIFNFEISKTGKVIVNELDKGELMIKVLNPVKFNEIQNKEIFEKGISFHFHFEKPNIIYYGIKDNETTKIKIIFLLSEERNIFYMNDIC